MKLKFESHQQFQLDAINAVTDLFEGQPADAGRFTDILANQQKVGAMEFEIASETGAIGNQLVLDESSILQNLRVVQDGNGLEPGDELDGMHFSIEMETGTGKTYVYLRTIFELAKKYNFTKYVILVPSVAIKEGVDTSIVAMKDHFNEIYGMPFDAQVYSGKSPESVHQFATSTSIQIMVMTIDSIKGDKNNRVIHQSRNQLGGIPAIKYLSTTRPIVIMDEPQNMESELSKTSIGELNPLCTLRYSATHKKKYNLVYQLDPVQAHEQGLVKSIVVAEVGQKGGDTRPYMKLIETRRDPWSAKMELAVAVENGVQRKQVIVGRNQELSRVTKNNAYEGLRLEEVSVDPAYVEITNLPILNQGESFGDSSDDTYREMIRETIREHLKKEAYLKGSGIKVLSLFFIDRVSHYLKYDESGNELPGKFAIWFEELLEEEMRKDERYSDLWPYSASEVHKGYFAITKKGGKKEAQDTNEGSKNQNDNEAYELIMRKKEELLSLKTPLRFIFSHSALREGWDNPNVFQICVLREMGATLERRQTIGRGLRLPVNQEGVRVRGEGVSRQLTVVANESYKSFADSLQREYKEAGVDFGYVRPNAFSKIAISDNPDSSNINYDHSKKIWEYLLASGMIHSDGRVTSNFAPHNEGFRLNLPKEYSEYESEVIDIVTDCSISKMVKQVSKRQAVRFNKEIISKDFIEFWEAIAGKTTYSVKMDRGDFVARAVKELHAMPEIQPLRIEVSRTGVKMLRGGLKGEELSTRSKLVTDSFELPDIVADIQAETSLTRQTIVEILNASNRLREFAHNPSDFTYAVKRVLKDILALAVVDGVQYEKIDGLVYELRQLQDDGKQEKSRFLDQLYKVKNRAKTTYDYVEYDSEVENKFAAKLDANEDIKLFVKLPREFKVPTPVGDYNPDWAIVKKVDGEEKIYMIRETKGSQNNLDLRSTEKAKIDCGQKHFGAIGIDNFAKSSPESWNI
jgi:type III restriction enzyme